MEKRNSKNGRKNKYPLWFRRQVVREVMTENLSNREARARFNLSSSSIVSDWYKKYSSDIQVLNEEDTMKQGGKKALTAEQKKIRELERALQEANMKITGLEMLIDIAQEELKIEIRKKPGSKQPNK